MELRTTLLLMLILQSREKDPEGFEGLGLRA